LRDKLDLIKIYHYKYNYNVRISYDITMQSVKTKSDLSTERQRFFQNILYLYFSK